jgi:DNA-binding SARP family transcriptional activator
MASAGDDIPAEWESTARWLLSVAYRRDGDLPRAYDALDRIERSAAGSADPQSQISRLRIDWLRGDVDHSCRGLSAMRAGYEHGDHYLFTEATLELAAKTAWLGESVAARELLGSITPDVDDLPGALAHVLHLITSAAVAVGEGDEERATDLLRDDPAAMPGRPESWYWRDRAALALPFVLLPNGRDAWAGEPLGPAHLPGLVLARALACARDGDLSGAAELVWPDVGVVRAHLPLPWVVEIAAAGRAAANPPPDGFLDGIAGSARPHLRALAERAVSPIAAAARALLAELPAVPPYRVRIGVVGPLELRRDDAAVAHPDLRRRRVRELLSVLAARRRVRREEVADELWPDLDDPGRNLRVTLNYLQRVLQPDRADGDPPFFVRAEGAWLVLSAGDHLAVDVWELDARLDEADAAERANAPRAALAAYRAVLPIWRGEPFADAPDGLWVLGERARLRSRYVHAALRAGELLLADGDPDGAREAARRAITADPVVEATYQLLARAHLAEGDPGGAGRAVEECRAALAELGLEPTNALGTSG